MNFVARFMKDESGATAIEYGLIAAIVGIGITAGLSQLAGGLNGLFANVNGQLGGAGAGGEGGEGGE